MHEADSGRSDRTGADPQSDKMNIVDLGKLGLWRFVNVDTQSSELGRATELGLVPSGVADLIVTSDLSFSLEHLYDEPYRGRVLAVFRHPVERLVSKFYYLQEATWEPGYHPEWKEMDIQYWADNIDMSNNYLVKALVGKGWSHTVTAKDFRVAMGTVRSRFVVGLMNQMEESIHRFNIIMGVDESEDNNRRCIDEHFGNNAQKSNANAHAKVEEGSPTWQALARNNELDIRLYEFIVHLFGEQREIIEAYASHQ